MKEIIKKMGIFLFSFLSNKTLQKLLNSFRNVKGQKGIFIRFILLKNLCRECGDRVRVHEGTYIFNAENLSLGSDISIRQMCYIEAKGEITIKDNVSIAHRVTIMSTSHNYALDQRPIKYQPLSFEKVFIGSNVWIGSNAVILLGSSVRDNTVVGANSLVNKAFEPNIVIAGSPAKVIKNIEVFGMKYEP